MRVVARFFPAFFFGAIALFAANLFAQTFPTTQPGEVTLRFEANGAETWKGTFDEDGNGFSYFIPGKDGRTILISSSQGTDGGDGQLQPIRTLKRAMQLLRNGYPDRLLFKRGDIFRDENLNVPFDCGGRSIFEPMMIGSYGDSTQTRPIIAANLALGGRAHPNFIVIWGLDFYADSRDPTSPGYPPAQPNPHQGTGIRMFNSGHFLWIEDCRFRYFSTAMELQGNRDLYHGLIIRRCVVSDDYDPKYRSQGIYLSGVDDVLIEENLFDHNGWNSSVKDAGKTIFNHNMYIQHGEMGDIYNIIVRGNIVARASSHGCQLRPGGRMENNLFLDNSLAGFVSYAPSVVRRNVVLGGEGIGPSQPRGQGLEILNCPAALIDGNIIAHKKDPTNSMSALSYNPLLKEAPSPGARAEFSNNIIYDWSGLAFEMHSQSRSLYVHDNTFAPSGEKILSIPAWRDGWVFSNNHYVGGAAGGFEIDKQPLDFRAWTQATGDHSTTDAASFADPNRDVASYAGSIGLSDASVDGFLAAARDQYHGHWDKRLMAAAVNDYIRAGFAPKFSGP